MLLPVTHPRTAFLEVVRITAPAGQARASGLTGDVVEVWVAEEARQVLELVERLPDGKQYRCFVPGWGVRAHDLDGPLFEIAFCFRCHGARLWAPDLPAALRGQNFDADSPTALELLLRFRSCDRPG